MRNPVITSSNRSSTPCSSQSARSPEEAGLGRHDPHVRGHGFDRDDRDVIAPLGEDRAHGLEVVERCREGVAGGTLGHTGR